MAAGTNMERRVRDTFSGASTQAKVVLIAYALWIGMAAVVLAFLVPELSVSGRVGAVLASTLVTIPIALFNAYFVNCLVVGGCGILSWAFAASFALTATQVAITYALMGGLPQKK
jgi:hypothetical protein